MNYKVLSRKDAIQYSQEKHNNKSIIISISGHEENFPDILYNETNGIQSILYLTFDDITQLEENKFLLWWKKDENKILEPENLQKIENKLILFDSHMAQIIVEFILKHKDKVDTIICHCSAGISRSSGCCAAIMKALEGDDMPIFNNPKFHPNMYVYKLLVTKFSEAGFTKIWDKNYN